MIKNLSKGFGRHSALKNVSFELAQGEQVALIGPSGAGKTTLLRAITGVIRPDDGQLRVLGQCLRTVTPKELQKLRKEIGFLYQSHNLVPHLRVVHNVLMARLPRWGAMAIHSLTHLAARLGASEKKFLLMWSLRIVFGLCQRVFLEASANVLR